MRRESVIKKLLKGLGFMLFGNILSGIMLISIAPVISVWFLTCIAFLFTLVIYLSLMFLGGYKDGERESALLRNHRTEVPKKNGWLIYGLIPGIVNCIPVVILMLGMFGYVDITGEYMFVYRFVCGAVMPLIYIGELASSAVADYPVWLPVVSMAVYVLGASAAAKIGFDFGFDEKKKLNFMYEENDK